MLELIPTIEDIRYFPLFDVLGQDDISEFSMILKKFKLKRGEHIVRPGKICRLMYFVCKGRVRQYYYKEEKEITEYFAFEGMGFFCIESFMKGVPSYLGVVAGEETTLLALPRDPLLALCEKNQNINEVYRNCLEESLIASQYRVYSFLNEKALERYERLLKDFPKIAQRESSVYIASYLGVSPETLSRMRHQLIREK